MDTSSEYPDIDVTYYDRFSKVYDWVSSKHYYHKPRKFAIQEMHLKEGQKVLNIPCGTGQNLDYFQQYLKDTGSIIGIDLSEGMLSKAKKKIDHNQWNSIQLIKGDATKINKEWIATQFDANLEFDAILCDLGLSGFPRWEEIITNLISLLKPSGRFVIMDWYIHSPSLRGEFIKWIGKGEVDRPLWQYMEDKVNHFRLEDSFKRGDMFVASGSRKP